MQIKILSILKVVSFESLAGDYFSERGAQAEAHWERNLNRQLWSIIIDEKHRIAVQGIFVGIIIKAGDASVKVTDLMFAFAFCKKLNLNQENWCPRSFGCLLFVNFDW